MGKPALLKSEIQKIKELRETGHSLMEIKNIVNKGYGTIYRYIKDVQILPEHTEEWKVKRGGSKNKALKEWNDSKLQAKKIINSLDLRDRMLILACLYWGEGNKNDLSIVNSDPDLLKVVLISLRGLGVSESDIVISLRLFEDIDKNMAKNFWLKALGLKKSSLISVHILSGKKVGKLEYGMCRLRVRKAKKYFKLIMSMIDLIRHS